VVEQVGADVTGYAAGDDVFGFLLHANPTVHHGSWAEYITVSEDISIAHRPANVDAATAGAAPLAAITALTAIDALALSAGSTVLIVGATGGVGSLAVQLAAQAGATVIAPALPQDEQYLRDLGVTEVVPRDGDVAAAVRERFPDGVDATARPRQLHAGHLRGRAQGRRARRLADRRRRRRPRPHHGHGATDHREP